MEMRCSLQDIWVTNGARPEPHGSTVSPGTARGSIATGGAHRNALPFGRTMPSYL